ncbi:Hypp9359 [Branchiostoma lanceolatum]|uniref:Hypp9359 protein n=1 Tax=Branchiostoma lanceolatum TaxID=7740 RepID=A0A8S4MMV4_BRALA|nr:Hypp9359 [Branchiostoma lanceolatum]
MGIRVFATNRHFNKLRDCTVLYMDGIFKSCPDPTRMRRHPALRDFTRYMELNYVNPGVTFPIRMWNVFERGQRHSVQQSRFHQRWNNIGRRHPALWHFIRKMKDGQRLVEMKLASARRGDPRPPQKKEVARAAGADQQAATGIQRRATGGDW